MYRIYSIIAILIFALLYSTTSFAQCTTNAGVDITACEGIANLNASPPEDGNTGLWTCDNENVIFTTTSLFNTSVEIPKEEGNYILKWEIFDSSGCNPSDEITITYATLGVDLQSLVIEPELIACSIDGKYTFNFEELSEEYTAIWDIHHPSTPTNNLVTSSTKNTAEINNLFLAEGDQFTFFEGEWKVSNALCSSSYAISLVYSPTTVAEAVDIGEICSNNTTIEGNFPEFGQAKWKEIITRNLIDDTRLNTTNVSNLPIGEEVELVWVMSSLAGRCETTDTIRIINNAVVATANQLPEICVGNDTLITAINNDPPLLNPKYASKGIWSIVEGFGDIENNTLYETSITKLKRGVNKISWTQERGICKDEAIITINNFRVTANAGMDVISCTREAQINAIHDNYGDGIWSSTSSNGTISNISTLNTEITNLDRGNNALQWNVSWGKCKAEDEVKVICNYFESEIIDFQNPMCLENNGWAEVTADGLNPFSYIWSNEQTNKKTENLKAGRYSVVITDANDCTSSSEIEFINEESILPDAIINGEDNVFAYSEGIVYSFEKHHSIANHVWTVSGGDHIEINENTIAIDWKQNGIGIVELKAITPCGAIEANPHSVNIALIEDTDPNQNLLTINGDGIDDFFEIQEISDCPECFPFNELYIYSMTGALLYNTEAYTNNWNGVSNIKNKDIDLPDGTYYYLFRYDKNVKDEIKTGFVVIFRD